MGRSLRRKLWKDSEYDVHWGPCAASWRRGLMLRTLDTGDILVQMQRPNASLRISASWSVRTVAHIVDIFHECRFVGLATTVCLMINDRHTKISGIRCSQNALETEFNFNLKEKGSLIPPSFPNALPYKTGIANALDPSVRERRSTVTFGQVSHVIFLTAYQVPSSRRSFVVKSIRISEEGETDTILGDSVDTKHAYLS